MNPLVSKELAEQHIDDLRRDARTSRLPDDRADQDDGGLTVRAATPRDSEAVRLLAALEGVSMPRGRVLVAQVGDEVVAALPLDGRGPLADPFRPSAHIVELLQLRARQLHREDDQRARGSLIPRLRGVLRAA
jgi:hypothetical protein